MFFNPLFISNTNIGNNTDSAKENKFTNTNYLFADIINVSTEKLALNDGSNIELESKNKVLFKNFENLSFGAKNIETSDKNGYLGDDAAVLEFLTSVLNRIETAKNSSGQLSKEDAASFNPEILKTIINEVNNGKKLSIPIKNNGKEIFVEIQKANELLKNADKEKFNSNELNISEEKLLLLTSKIEAKFSKLVSLSDETFKPQKNILSTLIVGIQKELNLSPKESDELKKTIIDEFVKVINPSVKAEPTQPGSALLEKQVGSPLLSNKLGLNTSRIEQ